MHKFFIEVEFSGEICEKIAEKKSQANVWFHLKFSLSLNSYGDQEY